MTLHAAFRMIVLLNPILQSCDMERFLKRHQSGIADHDVGGLHVAMNDPGLVSMMQSRGGGGHRCGHGAEIGLRQEDLVVAI